MPTHIKSYIQTEAQIAQNKKAFAYHEPNAAQLVRQAGIRQQAAYLSSDLTICCPPSRELSIALTKLDEVVMWAIAAIDRNEA
jgi:hypothetical protein